MHRHIHEICVPFLEKLEAHKMNAYCHMIDVLNTMQCKYKTPTSVIQKGNVECCCLDIILFEQRFLVFYIYTMEIKNFLYKITSVENVYLQPTGAFLWCLTFSVIKHWNISLCMLIPS